jgi:hypothetical protein
MYQIAPEDRMRMIQHQHEAMRATAARERLASAARQQASDPRGESHHLRATSRRLLSVFTWRHHGLGHSAVR